DSLIGKERFRARRKPGDRRTFRSESFERGKASHRVFSLALKSGSFSDFRFRAVDLFLSIRDLGQGCVADFLQRPEEEREINVEQDDEAHCTESELLDLVLG